MPIPRCRLRPAVFTCLGLCLAAAASGAAPSPADEIRRLEGEINAAYAANDLPKYFSYYADDLRAMYPDGPTTLPEYRTEWTRFIRSGGAILRFTYTDLQIQVSPSGDAVVATYRASVRTKNPGKDPVDENFLETDVFFKRGADWKVVEVHYSAFQPPAKP
jgi:ketosteroid isomerase-like protein